MTYFTRLISLIAVTNCHSVLVLDMEHCQTLEFLVYLV